MLALLVVLFIAELWAIIVVAQHIGVLETIGLLFLITIVGVWLVKRQGVAVLGRLQATIDQGRVPHRELVDGFLILFAGILLIPPGFITDAAGLLLLLPPVRAGIRAMLMRSFRRRTSFAVRIVDGMGRRIDYRDVGSRDVGDDGPQDAGPRDAGPRDAGPRDAGSRDADPRDAGPRGTGSPDAGPGAPGDLRRPPELGR